LLLACKLFSGGPRSLRDRSRSVISSRNT
jgi:hypothetical protein